MLSRATAEPLHDEEELSLAARNAGAIGYVLTSRLAADFEAAVCEARDRMGVKTA